MSSDNTINGDEVHIWLADCDTINDGLMQSLLNEVELNRAKRFRKSVDSRRYIISHGVLRSILSRYLNEKPESIKYKRGPYGKPEIVGGSWLRFNMSHSNGIAAYAIALNREVGIDLEYMHDIALLEISRPVLSANENAYLQTIPVAERLNAFFILWTRKEAYIKAIGKGFYTNLNEIDVSFHNELYQLSFGGSIWSIADIETLDNYKGAVAVHGNAREIKNFRWS